MVNYREAYDTHTSKGILFNHESSRRGSAFVTCRVPRAAARIHLESSRRSSWASSMRRRDWDDARADVHVKAMWMMCSSRKRTTPSRNWQGPVGQSPHGNHRDLRYRDQAYQSGCLWSEFVHVVVHMARCEIEAPRTSQASQLLASPANLLCDSHTLSSHVRRAQLFPIRFPLCCIFPDCAHRRRPESIAPWTSCEDSDEEAVTAARVWTTSLRGCRSWRLQTRCAMLLIHLRSLMFAAESSIMWLEIPPTSGLVGPLRLPSGGSRNLLCRSSHARPIHSPNPVLGHVAAVSLVQECTAPVALLA